MPFGRTTHTTVTVYTLGDTTQQNAGHVYRVQEGTLADIDKTLDAGFGTLHFTAGDTRVRYPVAAIARVEYGTEQDTHGTVELWQNPRNGDLFLRDPDAASAWVCQTTNEDYRKSAEFGSDAYDLLEGNATLQEVSGADRPVILDGLERVATYHGRHGSVTLEFHPNDDTVEPVALALACDYIGPKLVQQLCAAGRP